MEWIYLAQKDFEWCDVLREGLTLPIPPKADNFLIIWAIMNFLSMNALIRAA
jgi:hypothetical protein